MAILNNISVTADVDDEPLQEYDDNDHDKGRPHTVSKYIEAKTGARFSLYYKLKKKFKFTSSVLYFKSRIDGVSEVDVLALKKEFIQDRSFSQRASGTYEYRSNGDQYIRHFAFQELDICMTPKSYALSM